jgi:hypothetical protein
VLYTQKKLLHPYFTMRNMRQARSSLVISKTFYLPSLTWRKGFQG